MGNVAVTLRIMPEEASTDLKGLTSRIRQALGTALRDLREQDIAFGLKAVVAVAVVPDSAGGTDRLEQSLAAIPGVGSVETVDVTLV